MRIDPSQLARTVSLETGLVFSEKHGTDGGDQWVELRPKGHSKSIAFIIRAVIGWRHIEVLFDPGAFSSELLNVMRSSSEESRSLFKGILEHCRAEGAAISLIIDNRAYDINDVSLWIANWVNVKFGYRVGLLDLSADADASERRMVHDWISRMVAAVVSLMPLETVNEDYIDNQKLPEGASTIVQVNRYERAPKNRAAALSIHGYTCKACGLLMSELYGEVASGFIEVHHTTPISELGDGYLLDPAKDLLPLCPNCHSIIHRKNPPYTLQELKEMLSQAKTNINYYAVD